MSRGLGIGCLCLIISIFAARLTFADDDPGPDPGPTALEADVVAVGAPEDRATKSRGPRKGGRRQEGGQKDGP